MYDGSGVDPLTFHSFGYGPCERRGVDDVGITSLRRCGRSSLFCMIVGVGWTKAFEPS